MQSRSPLLLLIAGILGQLWVSQADPQPLSYRWAYRNPLSIINSSAVDLGEGSYNGTVNSVSNAPKSPTPTLRYSHGATTAFLPNGSFAVVWQGSPLWWEGNLQQAAYWALSDDDGKTFGPATRLFSLSSGPLWGPTIHVEDSTLYLLYSGTAPPVCQYEGEGGTAFPPGGDLSMVSSEDNGATWSKPTVLLASNGTSGKLNIGRLVISNRGSWLVPFWRERSGPNCWTSNGNGSDGVPGILESTDKGESWHLAPSVISARHGAPPTEWLIESIIVPYTNLSAPGSMLQVFRSNTSRIWQSWSHDDGRNWTDAAPGPLTAPNSKADMTGLPDGSIIMAFNNDTSLRTSLTLARSPDGGSSWKHLATLETNQQAAYSYPTVTYHPAMAKISVVYSVWQPPSNASAASAPQQQGPIHAGAATTQPVQTAGRRLKHAALPEAWRVGADIENSRGRRLAQVPYNVGAWGKVSYGIRIVTADLASLLGNGTVPQTAGR